jgi:ABC-2 type transport system permease protein
MSTTSYAIRDARTMLRRQLRRMARYPSLTLMLIGIPIILLLLFTYVFGETLGAGLGGPSGSRAEYVNYLVPGLLLITIASAVQGTAIAVAMDMYEGIIARLRTMAISRTAVLTAHVVGSLIQTLGGLALITAVALLVGFRPNATPVEWAAAIGLLTMLSLAGSGWPPRSDYSAPWIEARDGMSAPNVQVR